MLPLIHTLLPHKPPMILLDQLMDVGAEHVHCMLTAQKKCLYFDHKINAIPAWFGIEFMAQTLACWSGFHALKEEKRPSVGFLLGSRRYKSHCSAFPEGAILDIHATRLMQSEGIAAFSCRIEENTVEIASAQLTAYIPSEDKLHKMGYKPK